MLQNAQNEFDQASWPTESCFIGQKVNNERHAKPGRTPPNATETEIKAKSHKLKSRVDIERMLTYWY